MKENKGMTRISTREVNLKSFLRKVYQYKKLFLICLGSAIALAFLYISLATPKYEVATSILIDSSGSNRMLGESQYVQGGVGLIEVEKNLFNEIGIIKSFSLINQTVEDLNLDVTYYSGDWITPKEQYGYYPFTVKIDRTKPQLYNEPFEVQILSDTKYRLSLITDDFEVSNPANGTVREVSRRLEVKDIFEFGEEITHEYFTFSIGKSDEFKSASIAVGSELSFKVHPSADITLAFMSDLEVNNIDLQASIFQIVSYGPIVEKEVDFLGQLTHNYLQNKLDARNKIALSKAAFIRDQLDVITDSLTQSELELESFKKEFDAIDLGATATKAMNVTQNLQVNQAKLQLDIQYYNSVIKYIENNRNSEQFIIPSSSGITVPLINDNIIELKNLYAERSRKKFYVTSNNEEINILNQQIRESSQRLLSNLRNAVQAARRQLGGVSSQLASVDGVINSLPTREKQLLSIQRERTLYENLFNYLNFSIN